MHPTYYRGCWHVVSRCLFLCYRQNSSQRKGVYNPKTVVLHAALLHQGFPHCAIFPTAASRRSLGRISVPMWPFNLSVRLLIVDLVQRIAPLVSKRCHFDTSCGISDRFQPLSPSERQVAHVLLTRPPLSHIKIHSEEIIFQASFDLHVLGTPPAFILSQDQTL